MRSDRVRWVGAGLTMPPQVRALAIYERIGAPDAQRIRETLRKHGITTAPPPPSSESRQSA